MAYLGFVETDLAADVFAQEQVEEARRTMPAFITAPISVQQAARTLTDGIEKRSSRVGAPRWVLPMLYVRGLATVVMDTVMLNSRGLSQAIDRSEQRAPARS